MALAPIAPPAPPRLSTTNGCASSRDMPSAAMRPMMSVEPPGGKGMIKVTGLDGYPWASACEQHSARSANSLVMVFAIDSLSGKAEILRHVPDVGRVAGRGENARPLQPAGTRRMARGAHRCADAGAGAGARGDEPAGRAGAAAPAGGAGAARSALPHDAAPVLRRIAAVVPPSVARLAAFPAAEPRAAQYRHHPGATGADLERDRPPLAAGRMRPA